MIDGHKILQQRDVPAVRHCLGWPCLGWPCLGWPCLGWRNLGWPAAVALLVLVSGCGPRRVGSEYGTSRGAVAENSVNGTSALAGMFRAAGYKVTVRRRLSPRVNDYDVIVWAPNSFSPPRLPAREFLEQWLSDKPNRTLIYIGRDYDAVVTYWDKMLTGAPPEQVADIVRQRAKSLANHDQARTALSKRGFARWHVTDRDAVRRKVTSIDGPWSAGIDASKLEIHLQARMAPPTQKDYAAAKNGDYPLEHEVLLQSGADWIVGKSHDPFLWPESQVVSVANGAFLLNLPLVNREHRKLATRLIAECGGAKSAIFLESGPNKLSISNTAGDERRATGWEMLSTWPLGVLLMHVMFFGIVLCFTLYPIFGRPRTRYELDTVGPSRHAVDDTADFGRHITALGRQLERTNDRVYAMDRLRHYHEHVRRDSGARHSDPQAATLGSAPPASTAPASTSNQPPIMTQAPPQDSAGWPDPTATMQVPMDVAGSHGAVSDAESLSDTAVELDADDIKRVDPRDRPDGEAFNDSNS